MRGGPEQRPAPRREDQPPWRAGPMPAAPHADPNGWANRDRPQPPSPAPPHWPTNADAPAGPPEQGRWAVRPHEAEPPPWEPASASYSYVDRIRQSELVPTRKHPPRRGWRRAVYLGTFGLINLGLSPDERRLAELEAKIRTLLRGHYKIGVLGKGGVGKTTVAACVGSIFAELRQDDRVVAIDADTAFGKLASRIDPHAAGSYWELAADQHLHTFADMRSRVGNNASGLFVLAGESATARRRVLDPAIYREATSRLDNHFTISIIDCGTAIDNPVTLEVLTDLDALIVVSSPWVDGASAAAQTMEWLGNNGYTALLHRTVVVLNDSDGHSDKRTRSVLVDQFSSRGQAVVELPFDPHLRPGGVIDIDHEIGRTTRRRLIEIAAAIAEHFAATTDEEWERR
ncbi:MinD/ParA family protein [Mycobacterium branderi]|nr:MinD/ParA family protein [Mycobacterium branderi]